MSRRAIVTVPASSVPGVVGADAALLASFVLGGVGAAHVVERAGPKRLGAAAPHDDPLVAAFVAAAEHAGRQIGGVHVRANSRVPLHLSAGAAAAAVAGAAAANALLGLGFGDADVAEVASRVAADPSHVARAVAGHRVSIRHACEDEQ
jgi:homoserine kinase